MSIKNVTIKDIAQECGLAISSVSKALNPSNNKSAVSEATRKKVIETSRRLGYQPNWQAQALAKQKTQNISFVFKTDVPTTTGIYEDIVRTLIERFRIKGYQSIYTHFSGTEDFKTFVSSNKVDAYVILSMLPEESLQHLKDSGKPVILINTQTKLQIPQVLFDDFNGAFQATSYLLNTGHTRIAYYQENEIDYNDHYSFFERVEGISKAMKLAENGGELIPFIHMPVKDAVAMLTADPKPATVVICHNHYRAVEMLRLMLEKSVKVPEEISILTFNDTYPVNYMTPSLSAIKLPEINMANNAADYILGCLEEGQEISYFKQLLPEELVIRESTIELNN